MYLDTILYSRGKLVMTCSKNRGDPAVKPGRRLHCAPRNSLGRMVLGWAVRDWSTISAVRAIVWCGVCDRDAVSIRTYTRKWRPTTAISMTQIQSRHLRNACGTRLLTKSLRIRISKLSAKGSPDFRPAIVTVSRSAKSATVPQTWRNFSRLRADILPVMTGRAPRPSPRTIIRSTVLDFLFHDANALHSVNTLCSATPSSCDALARAAPVIC